MFYRTEDILQSIATRSLAPSSQSTFQNSDLIQLANEEMQLSLVPDILSCREDHFLKSQTISLVAGLNHYRVPERAIGNDLKEIFFADPSGNKWPIPRLKLHDTPTLSYSASMPGGFLVKGDQIVLLPTPSSSTQGTLEFWYYSRPNRLVPTSNVAAIQSISTVGLQTTLSIDTDLTAALAAGSKVDLLSTLSPFENWAEDCVIQAITGSTVTLLTTDISNEVGTLLPQVGDYVCPAQTANIPQVPQEFHPILAQMVSARLMEALGDLQKLQSVNAKLSEMRRQAMALIVNRVESEVEHVYNRNGLLGSLGGRSRKSFL